MSIDQLYKEQPLSLINLQVKFIGGKYNGLKGNIVKCCDNFCSVRVLYENKPIEIIEEYKFLGHL